MFIDSRMNLKVYNLTDYYIDYSKTVNIKDLVFKIDLFAKLDDGHLVDPERTCNNLIQINETFFMCICKSSIIGGANKKPIAINVFISIRDLYKGNILIKGGPSGFTYDDQRDGKLVMYREDLIGQRFWYLIKENAT